MKLRSGAVDHASPEGMRRPLISTRVRTEPRLRRATVAVPLAPLEMVEFCAWNTCGSWVIRSSMRIVPVKVISSGSRTETGLMASRVGRGINEPVTVISSSNDLSTACSMASCCSGVSSSAGSSWARTGRPKPSIRTASMPTVRVGPSRTLRS
jgi:hypothetical protein